MSVKYVGKAAILNAIEEVHVTGKKLDKLIQDCALSVIFHCKEHGDYTVAQTLIDSMPNGSRVHALGSYIADFSKMTYNPAKKVIGYDKTKEYDLEGAAAALWTDYKHDDTIRTFDLQQSLINLVNRASKMAGEEGHNIDPELLGTLDSMAQAIKDKKEQAKQAKAEKEQVQEQDVLANVPEAIAA